MAKYTAYLTDPATGQQVPYDKRYPQQKIQLQEKFRKAEAQLKPIREAIAYYQPGGGFGKGVEAGLERGRVKAMASGMQHLVGAGFAGTTMAGTLGKKYQEEVGAPVRAGLEERRAQALSGIEMAGAGMQFQAGQAGAQRSLQMYIAELQANLRREEMARRDRPTVSMTTPTGSPQARQFPSLYDQGPTEMPDLGGGGGIADTPWPTPAQGFWGASEKWRSEQPEWVTGAGG